MLVSNSSTAHLAVLASHHSVPGGVGWDAGAPSIHPWWGVMPAMPSGQSRCSPHQSPASRGGPPAASARPRGFDPSPEATSLGGWRSRCPTSNNALIMCRTQGTPRHVTSTPALVDVCGGKVFGGQAKPSRQAVGRYSPAAAQNPDDNRWVGIRHAPKPQTLMTIGG